MSVDSSNSYSITRLSCCVEMCRSSFLIIDWSSNIVWLVLVNVWIAQYYIQRNARVGQYKKSRQFIHIFLVERLYLISCERNIFPIRISDRIKHLLWNAFFCWNDSFIDILLNQFRISRINSHTDRRNRKLYLVQFLYLQLVDKFVHCIH